MGILQLIKTFDPTGTAYQISTGDSNGSNQYANTGFTSGWYLIEGVKLCFTIFTSAISTNIFVVKTIG